jgi:hypothetical protein
MPGIYQMFYALFEKIYPAYKQNPSDRSNVLIITALLETLVSFQDKMKSADIFSSKFHIIWCTLAKEEPFRMASLDCLFLLCSMQNAKSVETKNYIREFWNAFGALCSESIQKTKNLDDEYEFHKHLCKVLVAFGIKQVKSMDSTYEELVKSYSYMLLKFGEHPSQEIFNTTLKYWHDVLVTKDNALFKYNVNLFFVKL